MQKTLRSSPNWKLGPVCCDHVELYLIMPIEQICDRLVTYVRKPRTFKSYKPACWYKVRLPFEVFAVLFLAAFGLWNRWCIRLDLLDVLVQPGLSVKSVSQCIHTSVVLWLFTITHKPGLLKQTHQQGLLPGCKPGILVKQSMLFFQNSTNQIIFGM